MLFHTQFVLSAIFGWALQWKSPPREDAETAWSEALHHHGLHTLLGLAWAGVVYWLNPAFLWWLLPVVGALVISVPLSVYSSRVRLGRRLARARFFLIPEESRPPQELRWTKQALERAPASPGFVDAVVDPIVNALACACRAARSRPAAGTDPQREALLDRALTQGPDALDTDQRRQLLRDRLALSELHVKVWSSPRAHPGWLKTQLSRPRGVEAMEAELGVLIPSTNGIPAAGTRVPLPDVPVQLPGLQRLGRSPV
jgi:membrane glycosyltransferase